MVREGPSADAPAFARVALRVDERCGNGGLRFGADFSRRINRADFDTLRGDASQETWSFRAKFSKVSRLGKFDASDSCRRVWLAWQVRRWSHSRPERPASIAALNPQVANRQLGSFPIVGSDIPGEISEIVMKSFALKLKRFLKSEDGPTAVEYAVMLSLIVVVCITAVSSIGTRAASTFTGVANQLGSTG